MDRKQLQDERVLDMDPQPFFLTHHRLGEKLYKLREKVVSGFRNIDYETLTPQMTQVFGSLDFLGIADSGVNELFKPPRRGRPQKWTPRSNNVRTLMSTINQRQLLPSVPFIEKG